LNILTKGLQHPKGKRWVHLVWLQQFWQKICSSPSGCGSHSYNEKEVRATPGR
jgi:hypothetical protein